MKTQTKRNLNRAIAFLATFCTVAQPTYAINFASEPLFLANRVTPKVMIALSKDQQLYKKAYNDYSDLDGDGAPETTYKHSVTYYGYFDPIKCYNYANDRFEPVSITTYTVTVDGQTKKGSAYCDNSTGRWSGNFLNWVSMSRIDAIRKLLYGGMRFPTSGGANPTEEAGITVLERSFLPTDAHSWAKFYNGSDISKLTPFTVTAANAAPQLNIKTKDPLTLEAKTQDLVIEFNSNVTGIIAGEQITMQARTDGSKRLFGSVLSVSGKFLTLRINAAGVFGAGTTTDDWTLINRTVPGISFCNLTQVVSTGTSQSEDAYKAPPLIRVAKGNYALWSANERWQCLWSDEIAHSGNGNQVALSGLDASARSPLQIVHALGTGTAVKGRSGTNMSASGTYIARVKVCVSEDLRGTENCKNYAGNLKPTGLLQSYSASIDFGLMTGSYEKNTSGGVLRKAVGSFSDEILADGRINPSSPGIVKTLNRMRMYGYNYSDGTYLGAAGDNCNFQLTDIPPNACTSWGNPMAEIYYESLRYFASSSNNAATPAYVYDNTSSAARDRILELPLVNWTPPLTQQNACAKLNVLAFNASVSSDDADLANNVLADINTNKTARELTNNVGDLEGITNKTFFVGRRAGDASDSVGFELCTAKTVTAFGDAVGICPEGPTVRGSYLMAGLAHQSHTTPVRTNLTVRNDPSALKVTSYGIQLATNTPQLEIPVPGKPGQKVIIQPIYRFVAANGTFGGGALVDMKIVFTTSSPTSNSGKVYLNWEDSEQGGDYDQDMWGTLDWTITGTSITVFSNAISQSTSGAQGFGYAISGTTEDGPHFHSGINGFTLADAKTASYIDPNDASQVLTVKGCVNCQAADASSGQRGKSWMTYTLSTASTAGTLNDPLWYLAKYGGFDDANGNGKPDTGEWDVQNNQTGAGTPDGIPDRYFLVTNPLGLEAALERAFASITQNGSGAALASNAGSIRSGSAIYTASFKTAEWTGELQAFRLGTDGSLLASSDWDASKKLPTPDRRVITTYRNDATTRKGVPFRWPANVASLGADDIGKDLVDALNTKPDLAGTVDGRGSDRLKYLRGDASQEGNALNSFRSRPKKLGDIIHSSPAYVPSIPNDVVLDKSYVDFQKPYLTTPRTPMVYVAANDGMLHGFDASVSTVGAGGVVTQTATGGTERFAYMPSKTFANLNQLTSATYVHRYFNDGSPAVADAKVNDQWKTVLVGALGQGGRGIYALDVTTPPAVPSPLATTSAAEESAAAPKVLWEFNVDDDVPGGSASPFGLGYVIGQPLIRKMANGKWAAIISGGYNNNETVPGKGAGDGKAYAYIVFLDGPKKDSGRTWEPGVDYVRLEGALPGPIVPNGFAAPFASDINSDGMVDFLYMGDLLGNFWKFDVSDKNPAQWNNANNRVILFAAGASQPITAAAQGIRHPNGTGFILTFGTGKYLEPGDPTDTSSAQAFYGIWDKNDKPNNIAGQTVVTAKTQLFKQVIATSSEGFRYINQPSGVTAKGPNWATQLGWYIDLPGSGERSVFDPVIVSRRLVFSTIVPSGSPCDYGGNSFIMVVNPATGGEFDAPVIDVSADGKLTTADTVVPGHFAIGFQSSVGISVTPKMLLGGVPSGQSGGTDSTLLFGDNTGRVSGAGNRRAALLICGAAGQCDKALLGAGRDSGRATWREVVKK